MNAYARNFEIVTGHEAEAESLAAHNAAMSVIQAAAHARSVLQPRVVNNTLIQGFSGGNGRKHLDRLFELARAGRGMMGIVSDGTDIGGVVTASMPESLVDANGAMTHHGIFVDCFYVGPNRRERLVEGYMLGAKMAQSMRGTELTTKRWSMVTGRELKPLVERIPDDAAIYAVEPSADFEAVNRSTLARFLRSAPEDVEAIRATRAEANDCIVDAGFEFVSESDVTRQSYPKAHQVGRYALYEFSS